MDLAIIEEALENFVNWGGAFSDVLTALGDLFGEEGLPALSSALETEPADPEVPETDDAALSSLSSGSSLSSAPETVGDTANVEGTE